MNKIVQRIERQAGIEGLASILAEKLSPTDLQSLLLEVYRLRSARLQPGAVVADFESNRFVHPSTVSPISLLRWEQIAFTRLPPEIEPIVLSPVCPLGTSTRNTEVVSDSTNVLALECAVRRRDLLRRNPKSTEAVHLATSQRLLRAQHYDNPGSVTHFGSFALCSAGRDRGNLQFELSTLELHIRFYVNALQAFLGTDVPLSVSVTDLGMPSHAEFIETQLLSVLRSDFTGVDAGFDESRMKGRGYYSDICFHIHAIASSGQRLELVDGGSVNWTQKFLSNHKERLTISGIGSERLCREFGNQKAD
jgi:hypothetical protein